jgi:hypothetical protein
MRKFVFVTILTLATVCFAYQSYAQGVLYAPLFLFTNGAGSISPLQDGQLLEVGQTYDMKAIPDDGYVVSSWQPVDVAELAIQIGTDPSTGQPIFQTSLVAQPQPEFTVESVLEFTMQPESVILDTPSHMITESSGWQANFVPVPEPSSFALFVCGLATIGFLRLRQFHHSAPRTAKTSVIIPIATSTIATGQSLFCAHAIPKIKMLPSQTHSG